MKRALDDEERAEIASAKTLADVVYHKLRADIIWGRAAPEQQLRSAELQVSYGVGISPLREALSRLVTEGLVTTVGQRGFRVAPVSAEEIDDVLVTRLSIETEAIRRAIRFGDEQWEGDVVSAFHRLSRAQIPHGPGHAAELWADRHREFHMRLLAAARSPLMLRFANILFDRAERHRLLRIQSEPEPSLSRDVEAEHRLLLDAVLARDEDGAASALRHHYESTANYALSTLRRLRAS